MGYKKNRQAWCQIEDMRLWAAVSLKHIEDDII